MFYTQSLNRSRTLIKKHIMKIKIPLLPVEIILRRTSTLTKNTPSKNNRNHNKIFVIGYPKTGTTSLNKTLKNFGFILGDQAVAEILSEDWSIGRKDRIINYCHTADAFQDLPFMMPGLFIELDKAFPNSNFILTVRDSPEQWYNSLVRFHTKIFSQKINIPPSEEGLRNALYRYKGWALDAMKFFWNYPNVALYDEKKYKEKYTNHNDEVRSYFKNRPNDMIEINVAKKEDFTKLCDFLEVQTKMTDFPWENKT